LLIAFSLESERARRLESRLAPVEVRVVRDAFELIQAVETEPDRQLALLVDDSVPLIRGPMLGTLARVLPSTADVVFWGGLPPGLDDAGLKATSVAADATVDAIARRFRHLLEPEPVAEARAAPCVVVADDDDVWRATVARRLAREGYEVVTCPDGFAALEACVDRLPSLVLSDFDMPALDGRQLASLLKARFGAHAPPVLLLSSSDVAPGEGVDAVLSKSAPFADIVEAIRERTL